MHADTVFTGGTIRTGDTDVPVHDALAVTDGRISALGPEASAARGPRTTVVDLAGGTLLPAFGDGHAHPVLGGLGLRGVPVRECASVEDIVEAVKRWADLHPEAEWITGDGFDPGWRRTGCSTQGGWMPPYPTARCCCVPPTTTRPG